MQVSRRQVPRIFGVLIALAGVLTLASALLAPIAGRVRTLEDFVPLADQELAAVLAVQVGLLLLFIARQLARGKRRAWQIALVLLLGSAVLHIVKGLDVEEAALSAALAVGLVVYRKRFGAGSDDPSWWRLVRSAPLLALAPFAYGVTGLALRSRALVGGFSFSAALREVAYRLVWMPGPVRYANGVFGRWFPLSISVVGVSVALFVLFLAFRPVVGQGAHRSAVEEADLRRLIAADDGMLSYFMLRDDKHVFFDTDHTSALGYKPVGGVALVAGDPVGDPRCWPVLVARFADFAHEHGWSVAAIGLTERAAEAFTAIGLRRIYLGDEAMIDTSTFTVEGADKRKVRQTTANVERRGFALEVHRAADVNPDLRRALLHVSESWRGSQEERGFSMSLGRLFDPRDPDALFAIARDFDGVVRAFLHFVPAGAHGYSLDVMRRDRDMPSGLNEWLIVRTLQRLHGDGVKDVSLNFAFLRGVIRPEGRQGPIERLQRFIALKLGPWFQIESLYRFNNKFGPTWRPRYGVCEDRLSIPAVVLAAMRAEKLLDPGALRTKQRAD